MTAESKTVLTIEVGSTITKVNAFARQDGAFSHVAQGFAPTSVEDGDVGIGVDAAIADLESGLGSSVSGVETFVNSSAAGGLRMTVHGLTYSMTARAAREASLGAGAIVKMVTAGPLGDYDLQEIASIRPNIVLLAGGVDYGERDVVMRNAHAIAKVVGSFDEPVPVVYAGNVALRNPVKDLFESAGIEILLADNVFPDVDVLNVEPLRDLIHDVFGRHIVHAPGMARLQALTSEGILPTPGAVLRGAELFADAMGDAIVFDVGGATTDVHSVTDGSAEYTAKSLEPEPRSKRTVEGDLGVYVNARNILDTVGDEEWKARVDELAAMPSSGGQKELTRWLCARAVELGAQRHAGVLMDIYTPTGKKQVVKGKDLTAVEWVVATGGALTKVEGSADSLAAICTGPGKHLLPRPEARVLIDRRYLFSALGTLAQRYPDEVRETFRRWATEEGD